MQSDRKGGFIQPRCLTRPSLPLLPFLLSAVDFPVRPEGGIIFGEIAPHLCSYAPTQ